jgi:hypothetical protein
MPDLPEPAGHSSADIARERNARQGRRSVAFSVWAASETIHIDWGTSYGAHIAEPGSDRADGTGTAESQARQQIMPSIHPLPENAT